jgi:hypothetical protein
MKWKKQIQKQNARHYAWPTGWDPAEVIAEQLECSPERVREHLAPSIRCGEVEVKSFTVWDPETGRKFLKTGFRLVTKTENPQKIVEKGFPDQKKAQRSDRWPFHEGAKIYRLDYPERFGTVQNGKIRWADGKMTTPGPSCFRKYRLA